jgi:PAS domain S-box-containing protein
MVFLLKHLDYIYFFYGLSFLLLAGVCFLLDRNKNKLMPWYLLALFGVLHGFNEWICMMELSIGDFSFFEYIKSSILLLSFIFLFEFGRSGFKSVYPKFFDGLSIVWQYGLLLIGVFGIHSLGLDDFDTSIRYVFGFFGGMMSTALLFHYYRTETKCRYYFLVASICLFLYAIATGLVVNKGSFFLCQYLNTETFQLYAGFPVQMLRAALAITITVVFWEYYCFMRKVQYNALIDLSFGYGKWLTTAIVAVLCCGWLLAMIISNSVDRNQKEDLRITAEAIASGIRMENLKNLNGNLADLKSKDYKIIREYLREFEGKGKEIRWFYLTKFKDGKICFTLDSSLEGKFDFSPQGTFYTDAPMELHGAFKDGKSVVCGPYSDKWGSFISAFIPIMDAETRMVDTVLGCDINSSRWSQMIAVSRLQPIIITLLICIILVISFLMHQSSLEASIIIAESEKKYRNLFNNSNDAVFILDFNGSFIEVNEVACEKLGYTHDDFFKLSYGEIDSAGSAEFTSERINRLRQERRFVFETSLLAKDGTPLPVEMNEKIIDYMGVKCVLSIARDVSERKKAEYSLKDSELKYKQLFNEMLSGFAFHEIICDEKGNPCDFRFLEINAAFEKITGLSKDKIIGKTILEILPETEPELISNFGDVAITGKPVFFEEYHAGLGRYYEIRAFSHEKWKFAVVFNDITDRKNEEQILRYERDIISVLNQASSMKDAGRKILDILSGIEDVDSGCVYNVDKITGSLDLVAHKGLGIDFIKQVSRYDVESYPAKLFKEGKRVFNNYNQLLFPVDNKTGEMEKIKAIAIIPLINENQVIAVLNLASHTQNEFSPQVQRKITAITEKIAVAFLKLKITEALNEADNFNREIISSAGEGIIVLDGEFRYLVWNRAMEGISGINASDVIGKSAFGMSIGFGDRKNEIELNRAMKGEVVHPPDLKTSYQKTGKVVYVKSVYGPLRNLKGDITGVIGVLSDITERKLAEEKMHKLSVAMEQSPALITITDAEGSIEYVNPKFESLTGYALGEVYGKTPRILKSGEMSPELYRKMWACIKSGKDWRGQFRNRKKNNECFWGAATISPIYDDSGKITHFISIMEDTTRQKELQEQLAQSQKMESMGRLVREIAHDFNNIIQTVNGYSELIMMKIDGHNEIRDEVVEICKAGKRALELTDRLLLFNKKKAVNITEVDVNSLISNLNGMLVIGLGKNINLETVLFPDINIAKADPGQIEQVLLSLAVNAKDAMPDGGTLKIMTSNIHFEDNDLISINEAQSGNFVCISVSDTGSGMTSEVKTHLFEPFFTTKEKGKGLGLGLSMVYGIVSQHNGWLNVYSEPGKGTTFEIYLPATLITSTKSDIDQGAGRELSRGHGEKILLVDDENSVRNLTGRILKDNNYEVFTAVDALEAMEVFNREKGAFDLVFSDVMLPGRDGVAMIEELLRRNAGLKVIMASGYNEDKLKGLGVDRTGLRFIRKPYNYTELLQVVKEVLNG